VGASALGRLGILSGVSALCLGFVVFALDRGAVISGADRALQSRRTRVRGPVGAES
jgi:hypothetical protein